MSKSPAPKTEFSKLASRRNVLFGLGAAGLVAGCSRAMDFELPAMGLDNTVTGSVRPQISVDKQVTSPNVMYASFTDEGFQLPEIPFAKVDPKFRRQIVVDPTGEAPGTIVVKLQERFLYLVQPGGEAIRYGVGLDKIEETFLQERFLYLVQPGGEAIRYGVGIGRDGFLWSGRANIQYGKKWPTWTPPREMIARKPELVKWAGGQPGGLDNPLGARALYIFQNGQDTGYRVHGSPEWWTIGQAMSSGCVRMINQDVIDLYSRVNGKTPIVVG